MKKYNLGVCLFAIILLILILGPVWILGVQALIPAFDANQINMSIQPIQLIPEVLSTEQFIILFSRYNSIANIFFRDLLRCVIAAGTQCIISVVSGFLLAKYRSTLSSQITYLFLFTMILPTQIYLVPTYKISHQLDITNNTIVLYSTVAFSPFGTIFMKQVFQKFPDEYKEAYSLEDNRTRYFIINIIFPICFQSTCLLFLLTFTEAWSMIEQPLILLTKSELFPLSMLIYDIEKTEPEIIFAASVFIATPIWAIALFAIITKKMKKLMLGNLK